MKLRACIVHYDLLINSQSSVCAHDINANIKKKIGFIRCSVNDTNTRRRAARCTSSEYFLSNRSTKKKKYDVYQKFTDEQHTARTTTTFFFFLVIKTYHGYLSLRYSFDLANFQCYYYCLPDFCNVCSISFYSIYLPFNIYIMLNFIAHSLFCL